MIPTEKEYRDVNKIFYCTISNYHFCECCFEPVDKKGRDNVCSNCKLAHKKKNEEEGKE